MWVCWHVFLAAFLSYKYVYAYGVLVVSMFFVLSVFGCWSLGLAGVVLSFVVSISRYVCIAGRGVCRCLGYLRPVFSCVCVVYGGVLVLVVCYV